MLKKIFFLIILLISILIIGFYFFYNKNNKTNNNNFINKDTEKEKIVFNIEEKEELIDNEKNFYKNELEIEKKDENNSKDLNFIDEINISKEQKQNNILEEQKQNNIIQEEKNLDDEIKFKIQEDKKQENNNQEINNIGKQENFNNQNNNNLDSKNKKNIDLEKKIQEKIKELKNNNENKNKKNINCPKINFSNFKINVKNGINYEDNNIIISTDKNFVYKTNLNKIDKNLMIFLNGDLENLYIIFTKKAYIKDDTIIIPFCGNQKNFEIFSNKIEIINTIQNTKNFVYSDKFKIIKTKKNIKIIFNDKKIIEDIKKNKGFIGMEIFFYNIPEIGQKNAETIFYIKF